MSPNTNETSYSRQQTLLRCPKKYEYQYEKRIRPKKTDTRFLLGRAVHCFLEHYYAALAESDNRERAYRLGREALENYLQTNFPQDDEGFTQADLAKGMVKHYHLWATQEDKFHVLGTEVPFEIDIYGTTFKGIMDVIVQVGDKLWVMEHKTAAQLTASHTILDKQISVYVMAGRELGLPMEGALYNILRKAVPKKPSLLKSGKLSKALDNNITYESYVEAIEEVGHDPAYYEDVLTKLKERRNTFFYREFVPRTQAAAEQVWEEIRKTEALRQALVGAKIFPRNITRDCSWDCPYYDLCLAEMEGSDVDWILQEKYCID